MKIESVEAILVGSRTAGANCVVRITTDEGVTGLGQSAAWGFPDAVAKIVEQYGGYLVGKNPFQIEQHQQALLRMRPFRGNLVGGALSAVDIALWDIKGKHLQAPIWDLLGGRVRDRVRLHLLLPGTTPDEIATNARSAAEDGFTALKFDPFQKDWHSWSHARVIESLRDMVGAARDAVGNDVDLILEMHRKTTAVNAFAIEENLREFRPLFYEDPLQIDSIALQGEMARRMTVPVANGERMSSLWEFRDMLVAGGPQYVRPDIGLAGGITGVKKIAALAESFDSAMVMHNFLGPLLTSASIQIDIAVPNILTQEYYLQDESTSPTDAVFKTALRREGGFMPAPEEPGLGVSLDEDLLPSAVPSWLPQIVEGLPDGSTGAAIGGMGNGE